MMSYQNRLTMLLCTFFGLLSQVLNLILTLGMLDILDTVALWRVAQMASLRIPITSPKRSLSSIRFRYFTYSLASIDSPRTA